MTKLKPVKYLEDGTPIFTDNAQFMQWNAEKQAELLIDIRAAIETEAVRIAVNTTKDRDQFLVDKILDLEKRIDSLEGAKT